MKIGTKELFSTEELKNVLTKFENKINKQLEKKSKYEEEIKTLQSKLEKAVEKDILEGNNEVEITRITACIANTKTLLNIVDDSINNIKKIREERLTEELSAVKEQFYKDNEIYINTVELELFTRLSELRKKQEILLLLLIASRNDVSNTVSNYNAICEENGLPVYKVGFGSSESYNSNLISAPSLAPELGPAILAVEYLDEVPDRIERNRAEANAATNRGKSVEEMIQVVDYNRLEDVDLENFLKTLKVSE